MLDKDFRNDPIWQRVQKVNFNLNQASEYANGAMALYGTSSTQVAQYEQWTFEHLEKAAAALGYDLVKREREAA